MKKESTSTKLSLFAVVTLLLATALLASCTTPPFSSAEVGGTTTPAEAAEVVAGNPVPNATSLPPAPDDSGAEGAPGSTSQPASATASPEVDLDALAAQLLSSAELPQGWEAEAVELESRSGRGTYAPFCKSGLPARSVGTVSVDFLHSDRPGQSLSQAIVVYPSPEAAAQSFADYRLAAEECPVFETGDLEVTVSPLTLPAYGDETFAFRVAREGLVGDVMKVRQGEVHLDISFFGTAPDPDLLVAAVESALSKLE